MCVCLSIITNHNCLVFLSTVFIHIKFLIQELNTF